MRPPYTFKAGDNSTGQCSACREVFYGEEAFDRHRRGEEPERRCIDPTDPPLRRNGTPEPWWLDDRGRWHRGRRMPEDVRRALEATCSRAGATNDPSQVSQVPPTDSEPPTGRRGDLAGAHVLPVGDFLHHDLDAECACGPTTQPVPRHDGTVGWVYVHHSLDGRERDEASSE